MNLNEKMDKIMNWIQITQARIDSQAKENDLRYKQIIGELGNISNRLQNLEKDVKGIKSAIIDNSKDMFNKLSYDKNEGN